MQKIVIDTNVIVSSLIQKNYPYKIVNELFIDGRIILCISESLIAEYFEVLRRPKFAIACSADFIITGNTTDFTFPVYKNTKIVTPKEYWINYQPQLLFSAPKRK
jgi:predicted nucleic acid-binding protein